jgi:hypothetical protein
MQKITYLSKICFNALVMFLMLSLATGAMETTPEKSRDFFLHTPFHLQ